jgi:quinol monooxygenase YgiN
MQEHETMELVIFARFHAREGKHEELARLLRDQIALARGEPGCLAIDAYGSVRDPRLFFIHSRWKDEAAFDVHAEIANTTRFVARAEALIDHAFDASRTVSLS